VKFVADANVDQGFNHVNFALDERGEMILVYSAGTSTYTPVNAIAFANQSTNLSSGSLPDGSTSVVAFPGSASPGESNYRLMTNVVINEALTHTDPPLEDAVELHNPTASATNIGGWYLSNSSENRRKYQIPAGTTIPAGGYVVVYQYQFDNGTTNAFALDSVNGDKLYLSAAVAGVETGDRSVVEYGAAINGVSFGRYPTSVGVDFVAQSRRTFGVDTPTTLAQFRTGTGLANADPLIGPVVINEIMYNPTNGSDEYVELFNMSSADVPLYDAAHTTNHWKLGGGIEFMFPANVTISANGFVLVVEFDPAADPAKLADFRARYSVPAYINIFGPFSGALANDTDNVELYRPDNPQNPEAIDAGYVPYVLADRVNYADRAPWPSGAVDGGGLSLQRLQPDVYGNEPLHWGGASPTPGAFNAVAIIDSDNDGIPDYAEDQMGLDADDPTDALLDLDSDGLNNYQEYLAGTDPRNSGSTLALQSITVRTNTILNFNAAAGRTYSLLYKNALGDPTWSKLVDVPAQSVAQPISVMDTQAIGQKRFYWLVTPAQ
jgi:hypothetical protein